MTTSRPARGEHLRNALLMAMVQVILYLPLLAGDRVFMPASTLLAPPWARPGTAPTAVQDGGGTDKLVYTLPNVVHWSRSLRNDAAALLWNPDLLCGYPFLAAQDTCALYPLNGIHLLLDPLDGLLVAALLHGWIATFLAAICLRRLGATTWGARFGAMAYGASGWFLAHTDVMNFVQASAWIPLMVWGTVVVVEEGRARGAWALAAGTALSIFGGMAQVSFIGLLLCALVAVGRTLGRQRTAGQRRAPLKVLAPALLAAVLAGALAAPQLLPSWRFSRLTARARAPAEDQGQVAVRPWELTGLLAPEFLGSPPALDRAARFDRHTLPGGSTEEGYPPARYAGLPRTGASFMERVFYPGGAALLLALAGLLCRSGPALVAGGLTLLGLLASMDTPLMRALTSLPFFAFGNPRRFLLLAAVGLAAGAAFGWSAWSRSKRPRLLAGLSGALAMLAIVPAAGLVLWPHPIAESLGLADGELRDCLPLMASSLLPGSLAVLASACVLVILPRRWCAPLLLLICLADGAWLQLRFNPAQPRGEVRLDSRLGGWLASHPVQGAGRIVRFRGPAPGSPPLPALPPNMGLLCGARDLQGYEGLVDGRMEQLLSRIEPGISRAHHGIGELTLADSLASPLLDRLAVGQVVSTAPLELPVLHAEPEEAVAVYRRSSALPRIIGTRSIRLHPDSAGILDILATSPAVRTVHLGPAEAARLPEWFRAGEPPVEPEFELQPLLDGAAEIRVRYSSSEPFMVRVADTWHPGWEARLEDGRELPVLRVDHALRGVPVPAGSGVLVMRFRARDLQLGLILALLGLAGLVAWTAIANRGSSQQDVSR